MKIWIHQIKESMIWQDQNYKLLRDEWQADPDDMAKLAKYVESYGKYMELKGRYDQWHIDAKEVEAGTF